MGGKTSHLKVDDQTPSPPGREKYVINTLFSTFNTQTKKEVDQIIAILEDIVSADKLFLDSELILGQMFTSISQRATKLQNQLALNKEKLDEKGEEYSSILSAYNFGKLKLDKFIIFFENVEWSLSDIKTSERPNWRKNASRTIQKIRAFIQTDGNFNEILNQDEFIPKFKNHDLEVLRGRRVEELVKNIKDIDEQMSSFPHC